MRGFYFPPQDSRLLNIVDSVSGYGGEEVSTRVSKPRSPPRRVVNNNELSAQRQADPSFLDDSSYYGTVARGGGTTDSDWEIFAGVPSTRRKKTAGGAGGPKKRKGPPPGRLGRVYNNMDLLVNTSEPDEDNVSRAGSQGSIYSTVSKTGGGRRIKGLEAIYLQRLEHKGKRGPGGGGLPAGL